MEIKITILKGEEAENYREDMEFNFVFHQQYMFKGALIDGIIPSAIAKSGPRQ